LHKPPANEKEARARPEWPLWKQAIKEEVAAHKDLGTWSKTKGNNKNHKAIKTRFVFDIKHDAEGKLTRYKAGLVAQGFNQVPGRDFDETWAPVPNAATTRALFSVSAAMGWEIHYVDAKTPFLTWSKTKGNNKNHKAIKTRFVFDIKHEAEGKLTRYKAGLVAQGFNQVPGRDFDETWAPVPNAATTRALFSVSAAMGWEIHCVDVKTAFLNAKSDKEMYIELPDGVEPEGLEEMCRLNLALYGTKQARRLWGIKLEKELKEMGAVQSKMDPCLYEWHHPVHGCIFILVYVDDLIVAGEKLAGVEAVKRSVSAKFEVRDMGEVKDFIGMKVMRNRAA